MSVLSVFYGKIPIYHGNTNSIYICGAYTRTYYNKDMSKEEIYAIMGTTIGHEIGHAFDSKGSKTDKDGNKRNWWIE